MNLMVASEKHGMIIIGVDHELFVYKLDPITFSINGKHKVIGLENDKVNLINN